MLVDVDHSMKCMQEETFGPTLPIMKIANAEEGVRLANDSEYGLQASVWTSDTDRGEALARRIEAGVVCVNDAQVNYTALNLPMGGWKTSGIGTRHGSAGIRKYTKVQSLLVTRRAQARAVHVSVQGPADDAAAQLLEAALRARPPRLEPNTAPERVGAECPLEPAPRAGWAGSAPGRVVRVVDDRVKTGRLGAAA